MKKKLVLSTLMLSLFTLATINETKAQVQATANLGLINVSDFEFSYLGFNLAPKYSLSEKLRLGANLGFYFKSFEGGGMLTLMPISGLVEYSLTTNTFSPYLGADVGFYRFGFDGESESQLGFAPAAGFNFALSEKMGINANAKYHYIMGDEGESLGAIGINAGLTIGF